MKKLLTSAGVLALLLPSAAAFSADAMDEVITLSDGTEISGIARDSNEGMTRAEFTSVLVDALIPGTANLGCFDRLDANPIPPATFSLIFSDVSVNDEYAMELCAGLRAGYIKGYSDGSFHPTEKINSAEAAKALTIAFALPANTSQNAAWYVPYVDALYGAGVKVENPSADLTLEHLLDMIEMLKAHTGFAPAYQSDENIIEEETPVTDDEEVTDESSTEESTEDTEDTEEETSDDSTDDTGSSDTMMEHSNEEVPQE